MLSINVGSRKIVKSLYTNKILHNLLLPEKRIEVKYHNLHKTNVIKSLDYKQNIAPTNTKKSYPGIICRSNYSNDKNAIFNNSKQNYLDKNAFYNKNELQTQEKQSQYASVRPPLDQPPNFLTKISRYCTSCHKDNDKESTKKKDHGRYKYEAEVESAINEQILTELNASYTYLSMACYFGNTNIALPGSEGLYMKMHEEEHQHAHKLINYQNLRGGTVVLCSIAPPEVKDWESIGKSLEVALEMEKTVKKNLIDLHDIAEKHHDLAVVDMIITEFIHEQDKSICEIARLLTRYQKMSGCRECGCTEFLFDKELFDAFVRKPSQNKSYI